MKFTYIISKLEKKCVDFKTGERKSELLAWETRRLRNIPKSCAKVCQHLPHTLNTDEAVCRLYASVYVWVRWCIEEDKNRRKSSIAEPSRRSDKPCFANGKKRRDLDSWTNRTHGQLNFHLPWMMSGHGCFNKFRLAGRPDECAHCDLERDNDSCDRGRKNWHPSTASP